MYSVGLDVDKLVFTVKILLYAGNSCINSPLVLIALGTIYLFKRQPAGNLCFSTKATAAGADFFFSFFLLLQEKKICKKNSYNSWCEARKVTSYI